MPNGGVVRLDEAAGDFGKDHGLMHEVIVTGRKVGAGKNFWKKLAHDEKLFTEVVGFVAQRSFAAQKKANEPPPVLFFGQGPGNREAYYLLMESGIPFVPVGTISEKWEEGTPCLLHNSGRCEGLERIRKWVETQRS